MAIPTAGFGFMDNTIMIQAGHAIDCTIGVMFGLSTLAAAAMGQVFSSVGGVLFGGTLDTMARSAGLPNPNFTTAQRSLPVVRRVAMLGSLFGVITGSCLALGNLLLIDTERSSTLKLKALTDEQEFAFEVEASNAARPDATTLTVRGPDVDGLLASMTAALTASGMSLLEMHASSRDTPVGVDILSGKNIEDVFVVQKGDTKMPVENEELEDLARRLLAATKDPLSTLSLKARAKELEEENNELVARVDRLEKIIDERQITVTPGRTK